MRWLNFGPRLLRKLKENSVKTIMRNTFNQIIKAEAIARVTDAPNGLRASEVADAIIAAYPDEGMAWAKDQLREHVISSVERCLREATELPVQASQMQFLTESFKEVLADNPGLPKVLGVMDEGGQMLYKSAMACTAADLHAVVDYAQKQIDGLAEKIEAVNQFNVYREEKGVPPEQGYDQFLAQQQPAGTT